MLDKTLYTAKEVEKSLGVGHGYVNGLVKRGILTPVYLPGRKRPKYDLNEAKRAFGVIDNV